ncbi:MAG: crossover junction endodeoxyribonuclease RuvC [Deltaproteobacteria bacterium]|nr:crossover junction endodeoxyribonuclease RuvC [Deltaproteobacteria bacterium]
MASELSEKFIIGIDPGSRKLGYAVLSIDSNPSKYVECGVITAPSSSPLYERLREIGEGLEELLSEYEISEAAVENVFTAQNPKTAMVLGQARGMALYILARKGIPVTGYPPNTVKKSVTGRGKAPKAQVRRSVSLLAGLTSEIDEDASDALAVAYCHLMYRKRIDDINT